MRPTYLARRPTPNRTVITAVARDELKDNVFTQIDSALLLD